MRTVKSIMRSLHVSKARSTELAEGKNKFYKFYSIPKPDSHKKRYIQEPLDELKKIQRKLIGIFTEYPFHSACKALTGESTKTNADPHQESEFVLKVDIADCYSTTTARILLNSMWEADDYEWYVEATKALQFCLVKDQTGTLVLPTGAPTSPVLCNIALTPLDHKISALCKEEGYIYTRYMDDMYISTTQLSRNWKILDRVKEFIESTGYKHNTKKSRWYTVDERDNVIVTGIRVGKQNKIPRVTRRKIRAILEHRARLQQPLDDQAVGYLAFVKGINHQEYYDLITYYQRRLNNAEDRQRSCVGS